MKKLLLCMLACLLLTGCATEAIRTPGATDVPVVNEAPVASDAVPADPAETSDATAEPAATQEPAKAYLIVTAHGYVYEPLPLYGTGRFRLINGDDVNVVEVTEDSVCMVESTCENQDCVEQGTVSLENRSKRVLQNMIICLPNDVALELYTYEEMLQVVAGYMGGQAE